MSEFKRGDRVYVTDPSLKEVWGAMERVFGISEPIHGGTIEATLDNGYGCIIRFDDGATAAHPEDEIRHLD